MYLWNNVIYNNFPEIKEKYKSKVEKDIKFNTNLYILLNIILEIFEFKNVPENWDMNIFMMLLLSNGHLAVTKDDNGDLLYVFGSFNGEISKYTGLGEEYTGAILSGGSLSRVIGENCVLFKNNRTMTGDLPELFNYADLMTENDISLKTATIYTRLLPLMKVSDSKIKSTIDNALDDIYNGKLFTFISDKMETEIDGTLKSAEVLNLTDPARINNLQYIDKSYDDIMRRFYTRFGHSMANTQKMAQQNESEISMNDTVSMIYVMEKLELLQKSVEDMNNMFETNITVDFSESWQVRVAKTEEDFTPNNIDENMLGDNGGADDEE